MQALRSCLAATVITQKALRDVVSAIDREAQAPIRDVVLKAFPDHGFVGEESAAASDLRVRDGAPVWGVDPLDGNANDLRGYPQHAVSIALVEAGEPQVGVIYDPCSPPLSSRNLRARMPGYMAELRRMLRAFNGMRRSGSMALEPAYLASGRIDAFWDHDMGPWDAAAGVLLMRARLRADAVRAVPEPPRRALTETGGAGELP